VPRGRRAIDGEVVRAGGYIDGPVGPKPPRNGERLGHDIGDDDLLGSEMACRRDRDRADRP
jgi:hypothetical protein